MLYLNDECGAVKFPQPLTPEEEVKYINDYQSGSNEARDILIESNMRLVAHIVKKYKNYSKDMDDLISIGSIGLIKGVNTYNNEKGTKLVTYIARCIENEILMYFRKDKKNNNLLYLQDPIGFDKDGNEVTLREKIYDSSDSIDEQVDLKMKIKALYEKIESNLTPREREVIQMRYAINSNREITQREIAQKLNISRSYVSRIEKKALGKLKKVLDED